MKDKERYYKRWPNRRFFMKPGSLEVKQIGENDYDVTFEFTFDVENDKRRSVGLSRMSLGLRAVKRDFMLLRQDEEVLERSITNKN